MLVPVPRPLAAPPTARRDLRIPHAGPSVVGEEEEASDWFDRYAIVARPMRGRVQPALFGRQNLLEAPGHRIKILTFYAIT